MQELIDPFERLMKDCFPAATVRALEAGAASDAIWQRVEDSGFLDLLVPASDGGVGVPPADAAPVLRLIGSYAVPVPLGETMIARALLARAGKPLPRGSIALAAGRLPIPGYRTADYFLHGAADDPTLSSVKSVDATGIQGDLAGAIDLPADPSLIAVAAILRAALIAGAADRVLAMCIDYANNRVQFGKPIGRQQAIQQQIAVLAEQAVVARFAADIGVRSLFEASLRDSAVAKFGASAAATRICAIAHAVHGAIGISEEHDLQLFTRALNRWRLADGGEGYWAEKLGCGWAESETGFSRFTIRASAQDRRTA